MPDNITTVVDRERLLDALQTDIHTDDVRLTVDEHGELTVEACSTPIILSRRDTYA